MPRVQNHEQVGVIMGSDSDLPKLIPAAKIMDKLGITYKYGIKSAHRTPNRMIDYSRNAHEMGIKAIIAAAGGSAHLPGMVSAETVVPVLGVGITREDSDLNWLSASVGSSIKMPPGVPLAFMGLNESGATNAALFAARLVGASEEEIIAAYETFREEQHDEVVGKDELLQLVGPYDYAEEYAIRFQQVKDGLRDSLIGELRDIRQA